VKELKRLVREQEREERKLLKILTRKAGHFFRIKPFSMAGFHAASKADLMSRNAQHVVIFCFLFFSINLTRVKAADSVERPALKPCWLGLNQL